MYQEVGALSNAYKFVEGQKEWRFYMRSVYGRREAEILPTIACMSAADDGSWKTAFGHTQADGTKGEWLTKIFREEWQKWMKWLEHNH